MKKNLIFTLVLFVLASTVSAQSGRRSPEGGAPNELASFSVAQLFSRALNYATEKFSEFEKSKTPYTKSLHQRVLNEQKQLAAMYANHAKSRDSLRGDDFYYLGRLHWMGTNRVDAATSFEQFLQTKSGTPQQSQTSRSVIVVIASERKEFEKAEKTLAAYYANKPKKETDIVKMEKQLAHDYRLANRYEDADPHSDKAFAAAQSLLATDKSRARALGRLLDAGITSFEIKRELEKQDAAEKSLLTLRDKSIPVQSHGVYYRAVDELIKYRIETGRKELGIELYAETLKRIPKEFNTAGLKAFLQNKFKRRNRHYKILGEPAPKLVAIESWIPGNPTTLDSLKGKVVLLDFWATWCGPCLDAFPWLIEWHEDYKDDGLVILGVTRFYGEGGGKELNKEKEIEYLKEFKTKFKLPYGFAVAYGQANQYAYGATAIPTAVILDRNGIVRYVEAGSTSSRKKEIHTMIKRLLAK